MKQYKITQCNGWENVVELSGSHELIKKQYTLENNFNVYPVTSIIDIEENKEIFAIKEPKQNRIKTNKTAVQNSLKFYDNNFKNIEEYKDIKSIKSLLNKRSAEDIESIEYAYNRIVDLYCLSAKQLIHWYIKSFLKDAVKEIIKSNIELRKENKDYLNYLVKWELI